MVLSDIWRLFEDRVFPIGSTPSLFNLYNDVDSSVDLPNGAEIRRANLLNYLKSFSRTPSILVIGEAPGKNGCRFSGVPFTCEAQLCSGTLPFSGLQSSRKNRPLNEFSATRFWEVALPFHGKCLLWNTIPLHPHPVGNVLKNRPPTVSEIADHQTLISDIWRILKPKHVIALGRKAESALDTLSIPNSYIRHPSMDRKKEFPSSLRQFFSAI